MPRTKLTPQTIETIERLIDNALDGTPNPDAGLATGSVSILLYAPASTAPHVIVVGSRYDADGAPHSVKESGPTVTDACDKLAASIDAGVAA